MVSHTGPRVVRCNSCKGPAYPGKGPKKSQRAKRKFWGQQVLFGTKFLKFGLKRANLATLRATLIAPGNQCALSTTFFCLSNSSLLRQPASISDHVYSISIACCARSALLVTYFSKGII